MRSAWQASDAAQPVFAHHNSPAHRYPATLVHLLFGCRMQGLRIFWLQQVGGRELSGQHGRPLMRPWQLFLDGIFQIPMTCRHIRTNFATFFPKMRSFCISGLRFATFSLKMRLFYSFDTHLSAFLLKMRSFSSFGTRLVTFVLKTCPF